MDLAALEAVIVAGRHELPPRLAAGITYRAFVDPSGGRIDAAALSIAHKEKDLVVVDLARRWKSPHVPAEVVAERLEILKSLRLEPGDGGPLCRFLAVG